EIRYTVVSGTGEQFTFTEGTLSVSLSRSSEQSWRAEAALVLPRLKLEPGDDRPENPAPDREGAIAAAGGGGSDGGEHRGRAARGPRQLHLPAGRRSRRRTGRGRDVARDPGGPPGEPGAAGDRQRDGPDGAGRARAGRGRRETGAAAGAGRGQGAAARVRPQP